MMESQVIIVVVMSMFLLSIFVAYQIDDTPRQYRPRRKSWWTLLGKALYNLARIPFRLFDSLVRSSFTRR